jgi:hypothetical protein
VHSLRKFKRFLIEQLDFRFRKKSKLIPGIDKDDVGVIMYRKMNRWNMIEVELKFFFLLTTKMDGKDRNLIKRAPRVRMWPKRCPAMSQRERRQTKSQAQYVRLDDIVSV